MSPDRDSRATTKLAAAPLLLYGVLAILAGLALFAAASAVDVVLRALGKSAIPRWVEQLYLASGVGLWTGAGLSAIDLFVLLKSKRRERVVVWNPPSNPALTVVLTAYNDEASISQAVRDFASHPAVRRVIVVDNNSTDRTAEQARLAGAEVIVETKPGYGHCVYRCLCEGVSQSDTELTLLCEGDMTFRAYDIDKFLAYIPHAEIVNGTRIVEQLRERQTQLTTFMYYG
ncbi:MAG: glycosyltransferase, partial [Planctomycetota bacterium]|nr:glycosyltransferase [Planctomycetota bacterium]